MRFLITMNMPSRAGSAIHQIIAEYPVNTLAEFLGALDRHDFIVVEEFYKDPEGARGVPTYYSVGPTALNHRWIGKIKIISAQQRHENGN
jgi:hypothetical protein